ncbi:patatin-like phospholipase domain-containing protein 4 [Patiria miniata]|uniref:PNPLA domain-containing protein n=1 Tax=Patiria miniata TaxID=46514 RepID=A0A913ZTE0_PATMI|nr:patatin-like phospholipase domain-containing protein 4 [Patiria miniata]XP_038054460.1 patatin-like phospholipase domain-containing protein 4 [Patiria miniata]XP_038054470.1 patatin-like phospholipase domain-containing protein 4 [Patiria miniata]XP_038054478.1 patatin-like phospholipase domain-containing protein 4 [Patiria miniata]
MGEHLNPPFDLALAGSSFFGISNIGVAQCLSDHGASVLDNARHFGGVSSNALVAAVMATAPENLAKYLYALYDIVDEVAPLPFGALSQGFDFVDRLRRALSENLPSDAHEKATNRLHVKATALNQVDKYQSVSVHDVDQGTSSSIRTRGPKQFEIGDRCWKIGHEVEISSYESREELIEVLLGCIYVPWFPSWDPPHYNGRFLGDATLSRTSNLPVDVDFSFHPSHRLIRISPDPKSRASMRDKLACGWQDTTGQRFDISALEMFRTGNGLYPPPKGHLEACYADGYEDATRFLKFYHCYQDSRKGLGPRRDQYAAVHSVDDLR